MPLSSLPFLSFLSGALALDKTPALCDDAAEKWMNYGELRQSLHALSPLWHGTKRGVVLCAAPRTVEGVIAFLSACASGHVVLSLDSGAARLAPFIAAYDPEWIITDSKSRPNEAYVPTDWPLKNLALWRRAATSEPDLHPDLFLLLSRGGEGQTQTVRLSYKNVASNVKASCEALAVTAQERAFLHLPLAFTLGFSVLTTTLSVGGSLLLSEEDVKSRAFWDLANRREATLFAGTPFHYDYIARAGLERLRAPRIQTFWQAAGRMPLERLQEIAKQIEARKGRFFILYGQAEAAPRMSVLPAHAFPEKLESVGRPVSGGTFEIQEGAVVYTGPNVMMGYAEGRADLSRGDDLKGVLPTGERGFIDEDGFLYLTK